MIRFNRSAGTPAPAVSNTVAKTDAPPASNYSKGLRGLADRFVDAFDEAVGFDLPGAKPITLTGVAPEQFAAMETKVEALERSEVALTESDRDRLASGEIVSTSNPLPDGSIEELTRGVVDLPLESFLRKMPAAEWGENLADWKGGDVQSAGPGQQIERMVLRMPGRDLDMTKVETIRETPDGATVRWEVLKSDNGSVVADTGTLRLERFGNRTLVTWHSAHKLNKYPLLNAVVPKSVADAATGAMLRDYFTRCVEKYREVAAG